MCWYVVILQATPGAFDVFCVSSHWRQRSSTAQHVQHRVCSTQTQIHDHLTPIHTHTKKNFMFAANQESAAADLVQRRACVAVRPQRMRMSYRARMAKSRRGQCSCGALVEEVEGVRAGGHSERGLLLLKDRGQETLKGRLHEQRSQKDKT